MKKLFPYLIFLLILSSCQKKNQDVIEIYLTKERIPHKIGIPFHEMSKYIDIDITDNGFGRYDNFFVSYDTIGKDFIFLGEFDIKRENLEEEPFITNDEIIGFDFEKSNLILSGKSYEKFSSEIPPLSQFIVCINNKPTIGGYLLSPMSSAYLENYAIYYFNYTKEYKKDTIELSLFLGKKFEGVEIPEFKTSNPEFYQVFQTRNKENNIFEE